MTLRALLLNGPPRSGKDAMGRIVSRLTGATVCKFASSLKDATHGLYAGLKGKKNRLAPEHFEAHKDHPSEFFMGVKPREAYIRVSEVLLKELHGAAVFGEILRDRIMHLHETTGQTMFVVTDSGFWSEASVLQDAFGYRNVAVIQMHRPDATFMGDSRGYVELPGSPLMVANNSGSLRDLEAGTIEALEELNKTHGWGWPIQTNQLQLNGT